MLVIDFVLHIVKWGHGGVVSDVSCTFPAVSDMMWIEFQNEQKKAELQGWFAVG